jgi:NAD(P)-dependent dehydrogenase (short-subunit alcohol dehydrogenase family)
MKTVLITGGTGDLGRAVLPRLLDDYRCAVVYRSEESWAGLVTRIGHSNRLDGLRSLEEASRVAPLHALVHLAGGFTAESREEDFRQMFETNVIPATRSLATALPLIEDGGRAVFISAAISLTKPAGLAAYVSSKAALNALVEVTAKEQRSREITVNAILPSTLATDQNKATNPSDKLVPLENVAETVAFLLSDAGASVTGQLIVLS